MAIIFQFTLPTPSRCTHIHTELFTLHISYAKLITFKSQVFNNQLNLFFEWKYSNKIYKNTCIIRTNFCFCVPLCRCLFPAAVVTVLTIERLLSSKLRYCFTVRYRSTLIIIKIKNRAVRPRSATAIVLTGVIIRRIGPTYGGQGARQWNHSTVAEAVDSTVSQALPQYCGFTGTTVMWQWRVLLPEMTIFPVYSTTYQIFTFYVTP